MRSRKYDLSRVVAKANAQIEGFVGRPELEMGMPVAPDAIRASVAKALDLKSQRDGTLQHAQVLTGLLHEALFELSRQIELNLVAAEIKYDLGSNEVKALGGKMRIRAARPKPEPTQTAAPPIAGEDKGSSGADATPKVA